MTCKQLAVSMLMLVGTTLAGCETMTPRAARQEPVHFTMGVEQDGQRIPVNGHTVRIRRAPFRLVFYFEQMGSMLAHASLTDARSREIQSGRGVNDLFPPGASIAEELHNPQRSLYLSDTGYHNWLYLGPRTHRFDPGAVHQLGERGFICRRTVERIIDARDDRKREIPLGEFQADRIYLGFVQTERIPGSNARQELQRDWLIVEFTE